ncbi:hypothetical protein B0H19DRAFT_1203695, partial [Mycena capillaripes]
MSRYSAEFHFPAVFCPKVATHDLQTEISGRGVADKVASIVESGEYDSGMYNFAPPDMMEQSKARSRCSSTRLYISPPRRCKAAPLAISPQGIPL